MGYPKPPKPPYKPKPKPVKEKVVVLIHQENEINIKDNYVTKGGEINVSTDNDINVVIA